MDYVKGFDVSHWNDAVPWQNLWNRGYRFAFIKVTQGTMTLDPKWIVHYTNAKRFGFYVGPYHYFDPADNGIAQADWMMENALDVSWDLGWALDVEEESGYSQTAQVVRIKAWIGQIRQASILRPIIYTSAYKWNKMTGDAVVDADLWAAHWTSAPTPYLPKGWDTWLVWQWMIDRDLNLDINRFNGDEDALLKYMGKDPSDVLKRIKRLEERANNMEDWINSYQGI